MSRYCPVRNKDCRSDCVLYRKGLRYFEGKQEPEAFEECAVNIGVDCLESLVSRSIGSQKASEQTRNEVNKLNEVLFGLAKLKMLEDKS